MHLLSQAVELIVSVIYASQVAPLLFQQLPFSDSGRVYNSHLYSYSIITAGSISRLNQHSLCAYPRCPMLEAGRTLYFCTDIKKMIDSVCRSHKLSLAQLQCTLDSHTVWVS